jgi:hypothetical protein
MDSAPRRPRRRSSILVLAVVVGGLAGCRVAATPSSSPIPLRTEAASPAPAIVPTPAPATAGLPHASLVVARAGDPRWRLIDAQNGADLVTNDEFTLPVGAPRPGWGRIVSAATDGDRTVVRDEIVQPGFGGPELAIDGQWRLPSVGDGALPAGVSAAGSTIFLDEADAAATAATTRFAIVEHTFGGKPSTSGEADLRLVRVVELAGRFAFDALSSDGRILYVVQHLDAAAGGHYQVRAVDLPAGSLRPDVIVDKANPDEWMAGYPIAQVRRADGVVMTLYDGPEHPFIHALQSNEAWALCIDLPVAAGAERSAWGLVADGEGRAVYAANGSSGLVVEVDPEEFAISRTATLHTTAATSIVLAKFGHSDIGPVGQRVVALPGGKGLLVGVGGGVAIVNGKDFREAGRVELGHPIVSIGTTPDGSIAFALTGDGRVVAFEPRPAGRVFGDVPNGPFSGLLAVAPW